jgi:hypothetical protein
VSGILTTPALFLIGELDAGCGMRGHGGRRHRSLRAAALGGPSIRTRQDRAPTSTRKENAPEAPPADGVIASIGRDRRRQRVLNARLLDAARKPRLEDHCPWMPLAWPAAVNEREGQSKMEAEIVPIRSQPIIVARP